MSNKFVGCIAYVSVIVVLLTLLGLTNGHIIILKYYSRLALKKKNVTQLR